MLDNSGINCYLSKITYQEEWTRWGHFLSSEASLSATLRHRQNHSALRDSFSHHLPFSLRSLPLFPLPHISSLMPFFPPLPPPASWGPCAGGAITEGGIDSFAVMWFGLQRGTAQSNTLFFFLLPLASAPSSSPSPVCSSSCVFKQANQHHSDTLASLFPLPFFPPPFLCLPQSLLSVCL